MHETPFLIRGSSQLGHTIVLVRDINFKLIYTKLICMRSIKTKQTKLN